MPPLPEDPASLWLPRPAMPPLWQSLRLGARNRCPVCSRQPLFAGYLKVSPQCRNCRTMLGAVRADDAPPYFTILLVGHIIVPLLLLVETRITPPLWLEALIFLPLTSLLTLALLRPIKGATVAWVLHHQREAADPHG